MTAPVMPTSLILRGSRSLFRLNASRVLNHTQRLVGSQRRIFSSKSSDTPTDSDALPGTPEPSADPLEIEETAIEGESKQQARRPKITSTTPKDEEPMEIPGDLNILWSPADTDFDVSSSETALPPPDILEEAMHNLHITLHPQTQHRATYASSAGPPIEPTLGLYCPIEGGDYVIDATVRELARRAGAEVLVLDGVQLAAGEWGQFGKAADCLQLFKNPLHFSSAGKSSNPRDDADEEDEADFPMYPHPPPLTLTLMTPPLQGRPLVARRTSPPPSKTKIFFDALVNTPSPKDDISSSASSGRPRIVYIRDFPTLAPSSNTWYPPLLSSIRSRRRGPISRPSAAVACPMTIIFGMTPPLLPSAHTSSPPESGLVLMSRSSTQLRVSSTKHPKVDWGESEAAEKAREKRLRERLKKWENSETGLYSEFPVLSSGNEAEEGTRPSGMGLVFVGSGMSGLPPMFTPQGSTAQGSRGNVHDNRSSFFRSSVLVPAIRSPVHEKACRIARRREINELTMRMGVGAVGGQIEEGSPLYDEDETSSINPSPAVDGDANLDWSNGERMWKEWGDGIELWTDVRRIADRAVGKIMAIPGDVLRSNKISLESTVIPWFAVWDAWTSHKANNDLRKQWLKDVSSLRGAQEEGQEEETEDSLNKVDEVVEKLRNDGGLDDHEERLLPCIVNSATMPTSFSQVHLPAHTIDSVRTIVSLPLLHPHAFKQGILKEHSMTGCLLFGPPGTGKTLVVRALAKEAGCRMLAVSPSDVLDMYVGEGEKLVRAVFSLARKLSPCVVFLDEIDALFGARTSTRESGSAMAHRGVITEFMQEMDGLKSSKDDGVIVIGATNRPFDLDDAVLRRLPRRLLVDLPGEKERGEILKILLRDETLAIDIDINRLARQTESFSGSDLKHLCVSAALDAVKERTHLPWVTTSSNPALRIEPVILASLSDEPCQTESQAENVGHASEQTKTPFMNSEALNIENVAPENAAEGGPSLNPEPSVLDLSQRPRILHLRNFAKALKEITPSSSESLGSLAELRKWNEEFGEGRQSRRRQQVWGRGRFGFVEKMKKGESDVGRVVPTTLFRSQSKILDILNQQ